MTKLYQVYKCDKCGNIVEVLHESGGELVCCGQPMTLQTEKSADKTTEKHVPVIEKLSDGKTKVYVGTTLHPMTNEHFIEWIEVITSDKIYRKYLKPGSAPEAIFTVDGDIISAREYCNVHGHWKS